QFVQKCLDYLFRPVVVEIDVPPLWESDHAFGFARERKKLLAEPYRHDTIEFAMQRQQRRADARDTLVRTKRILYQPTYRREGISRRPHIGNRSKRCVKNQPSDFTLAGHRNGNPCAERLAPEHDVTGGVA